MKAKKGDGHEEDSQDQEFFAGQCGKELREAAGMEILNFTVPLHLDALQEIAEHGGADDHGN